MQNIVCTLLPTCDASMNATPPFNHFTNKIEGNKCLDEVTFLVKYFVLVSFYFILLWIFNDFNY